VDAPRHREQPPARVLRYLLRPAPGDQEDLRDDVVGIGCSGTSAYRVVTHRAGMGRIQTLELLAVAHIY
jgi:hypothetical protein